MTFPRSKSLQVELRKVEGFWSELQLLQQTLSKYLNVEQQAHWMLMWKETNHLWSIMMWLYHTELESASAIIIKTFIPADMSLLNFMIERSKSTHFVKWTLIYPAQCALCKDTVHPIQITFIVPSPQHMCLGEWNSWEHAPDSAETIYI